MKIHDEYIYPNYGAVSFIGSGYVVFQPDPHLCEKPDLRGPLNFTEGDVFVCRCGKRYTLSREDYCPCPSDCVRPYWWDRGPRGGP